MKIDKLLILLFVFLCSISCTDDYNSTDSSMKSLVKLTPDELTSVTYDNAGLISPEQAIQLVREFENEIVQKNVTRADKATNISLKQHYNVVFDGTRLLSNSKTRTNEEETISAPIYELNMDNGKGLVLVSGDERSPSILAYIPELPNPEEGSIEEVNLLLEWSKASFMASLMKQKEIRNKLKEVTINKIATQLSILPEEVTEQIILENTYVEYNSKLYTRSKPTETIPGQIYAYAAPILQTNWSQGQPYRSKLPVHDKVSNGWGGYSRNNVPAGCAVVNLAQLFAYCEPNMVANGTHIDWKLLKQTPKISTSSSQERQNMVADLIKQLYEDANTHSDFNEEGIVTGSATDVNDFIRVLTSKVNANPHVKYDADEVYGSLRSFRPCVIRGEGHSFTIDGYIISEKMTRQLVQIYDVYWHAVLGWGSSDTAWYKLDLDTNLVFEAGGHTFNTKNLMILSHIRPK